MTFFQNLYKSLFPRNKQVEVHEVLTRSSSFLEAYNSWKKSDSCLNILSEISRSWHFKRNNIKSVIEIEIYISPYSNGLTILSDNDPEQIPLAFIMEYINEKLLENNYIQAHSDRKIQETENFVVMLERYYLKPNLEKGLLFNQLYGIVHIELKYLDNELEWLKIMTNVYSGRKYKDPLEFSDLISFLFDN